jgi:hypothetical protein
VKTRNYWSYKVSGNLIKLSEFVPKAYKISKHFQISKYYFRRPSENFKIFRKQPNSNFLQNIK